MDNTPVPTYYLLCVCSLSIHCPILLFDVTVDAPPVMSLHPMNVTVDLTSNDIINVTLTCGANSTLCYYWERQNDIILLNDTGVDITTEVNSTTGQNVTTLILIGVQPEDADDYQCVAINENGHSKSDIATVTVNGMNLITVIVRTVIICI